MTDPKPLTTDQLAEIAARAAAATPGPWEEHTEYGPHFYAYLRGPYLRGVGTLNFGDGEDAAADREFVEHASEDVDALLAEVRRLQADLTQYEVLNPQQCPAGKHADWLVDSEYAHACPWCQIETLKGAAPVEDTLPAWLYTRFNESLDAPAWDLLADADRTYWEHHAAAVRRAVARGGFKAAEGAQR